MQGKCYLCHKVTDLQKSHIIPRFVFRWLKETSPGFIRDSKNPNIRTQDGIKEYLLCEDCEQLFSSWEREFANNIYYPFHSNLGKHEYYDYGNWCLKFAVSVSWRVLTYGLQKGLSNLSGKQLQATNEAELVWRKFLLGKRKDPGRFCQHLLPLDIIKSLNLENPSPFLNRYVLRAIDMDIPSNNKLAFTYVKLGRLVLFGVFYDRYPDHWKGTKIHVRRGTIGRKRLFLPARIDEYLVYRANKAGSIMAKMSESQRIKVDEMIKANLDDIHKYEIYDAINQDVLLFGDDAFNITKNSQEISEGDSGTTN